MLVSTSDWDDHMFAHSLEDQSINDAASNDLLGVAFNQQQQYDMPLLYTHNDSVLAQELEKQVKKMLDNIVLSIINYYQLNCVNEVNSLTLQCTIATFSFKCTFLRHVYIYI